MTMIPLNGVLSSAAGSALSQTAGTETERAQRETAAHRRAADANLHAEQSAGIGQTEQDRESNERDADGRRLWEHSVARQKTAQTASMEPESDSRQSKDPSGQSGTRLDLTG